MGIESCFAVINGEMQGLCVKNNPDEYRRG